MFKTTNWDITRSCLRCFFYFFTNCESEQASRFRILVSQIVREIQFTWSVCKTMSWWQSASLPLFPDFHPVWFYWSLSLCWAPFYLCKITFLQAIWCSQVMSPLFRLTLSWVETQANYFLKILLWVFYTSIRHGRKWGIKRRGVSQGS